ncbi:hypothetical protein SAMN05877809_105273 [Rhodobacter sp. JA431]|uniref:hypothetical protein n=1 Tax=Rhodobacter sp. JA431 TaxID=570013 RepID=UPI000BD09E3F|nr:hypothetical protein [Rhodobacter sp. JA431]SOC11386.1 hypothetical protein SAMN05877809_105273 [Rhodobacter sp. JA431]
MAGFVPMLIDGPSGQARMGLRIETERMVAFLDLIRAALDGFGDGEIEAIDRLCDYAGLIRLVQVEPEAGKLVLLAVPSLRLLHFLDRFDCAPWAAMAQAYAGISIPPELSDVDSLLARAF